jgi:prevent-host-death family protein
MTSVSIRELSNNASAVIRRVAAGETIEVTNHDNVVAIISPVAQRERAYAALVSAGVLTGGSGVLGAILGHRKIQLGESSARAADILAQLRDEDDQ